jgi:hypothetical protein
MLTGWLDRFFNWFGYDDSSRGTLQPVCLCVVLRVAILPTNLVASAYNRAFGARKYPLVGLHAQVSLYPMLRPL